MKNQTIAKIINCLHTAYLVELGEKPISNKQLHYLECALFIKAVNDNINPQGLTGVLCADMGVATLAEIKQDWFEMACEWLKIPVPACFENEDLKNWVQKAIGDYAGIDEAPILQNIAAEIIT